jgi:plastocyanin
VLRTRRILVSLVAGCLVTLVMTACGDSSSQTGAPAASSSSWSASSASAPVTQGPATVDINIPGQDRFAPFAAWVAPGGTITMTNKDTDTHTVTSLPGAAVQFNVVVKGGESGTLTMPAGTFRYYCSLHAKYVADTDQVAATSTTPRWAAARTVTEWRSGASVTPARPTSATRSSRTFR